MLLCSIEFVYRTLAAPRSGVPVSRRHHSAAGLNLERMPRSVCRQATAATYRELTRLDVAFHETLVRAAENHRLLAAG